MSTTFDETERWSQTMKLDLDGDDVVVITLYVDQIRHYFDGGDLPQVLETSLDEIQAPVFTGEKKSMTLVISVVARDE